MKNVSNSGIADENMNQILDNSEIDKVSGNLFLGDYLNAILSDKLLEQKVTAVLSIMNIDTELEH